MDYEYYYNNAKNRYYNACSEISSCNNALADLNSRRQQKVNQINNLNSKITKYENALDQLDLILQKETELNEQCSTVTSSVSEAAEIFTNMVHSSDVTAKNLNDVYGIKNTGLVGGIFEEVRLKKNGVLTDIESLRTDKSIAQSELESIDGSITSVTNSKSSWESQKRSASCDMDYYKRKMDEQS